MSIATLDPRLESSVVPLSPRMREFPDGTSMTVQKRIRFECFLMVGHAGAYMEYQCRSQAPFELELEGPKTIEVFMDRVEQRLRSPAMMAELGDADIEDVVTEVRYQILHLEHDAPRTFSYRLGNVSFSGETSTGWCHRFP